MTDTTSIGGVIVRHKQGYAEILLIRDLSYDDWFLPKGHMEAGESEEQTARRGIKEKVGLTELELHELLGQYVRQSENGEEIKTDRFYLLALTGNEQPETEEGKSWEIGWFGKSHLPAFYLPGQESIVRDNWDIIEKAK